MVGLIATLLACGDDENPASPQIVTLTVENHLGEFDIYSFQASEKESDTGGPARLLPGEIVRPGEAKQTRLTVGVYDLRVSDEDGDCYYELGRKIESDYTWRVELSALDEGCSNGKPVAVMDGK